METDFKTKGIKQREERTVGPSWQRSRLGVWIPLQPYRTFWVVREMIHSNQGGVAFAKNKKL